MATVWWRHFSASVALVAGILAGSAARAAVPAQVTVNGVLTSAGGTAAADGNYLMTFALYDGAQSTKALWTEQGISVAVKGGTFSFGLGSKVPLAANTLGGAAELWLGVTVGSDPELPRTQVLSAPYALVAGVAQSLACSGCIDGGMIAASALQPYAKTADLAGYVKPGDLGAYAKTADLGDYVKASSLAAVAGTGSYKDLKDKPTLADVASSGSYADLLNVPVHAKVGAACGTGLAMKGIKADGSYDCVALALPADGLAAVSNGLLTNVFTDTLAAASIKIPDGNGAGAPSTLVVPDFGTLQGISLSVTANNSDVSQIIIKAYDPTGAQFELYKGGKAGGTFTGTFPSPNATISGDLKSWIGKNPQGQWSVVVADPKQDNKGTDGDFTWTMTLKYLSGKKVAATGLLQAPQDVEIGGKGVMRRFDGSTLLYSKTPQRWSHAVNWSDAMKRVRDHAVTIDAPESSLVIATVNGHTNSPDAANSWMYADMAVDGLDPLGDAGQYHIYRSVTNGAWAPFTFTQMFHVDAGQHVVELRARSSGTFYVNGAALTVAVIPRWINGDLGTKARPGKSCLHIKGSTGTAKDGLYWVDPDDAGSAPAREVYCDMNTQGGGWALLGKSTGDCAWQYSADLWTKANVLNDAAPSTKVENAKYGAFNDLPITEVRANWPALGGHEMGYTAAKVTTALQLFQTTVDLGTWDAPLNGAWASQGGYNQYGINLTCNASVPVRWGWMFNNEGDCGSNDSSTGLGMNCWGGKIGAGSAAGCCTNNGKDNLAAPSAVLIFGR